MKQIAFFFCVIALLCLLCAMLFLKWQSQVQQIFRRDADFHWIHDCLDDFIVKKNRFPINWEEMHKFTIEHGLYPCISGIEDRVVLNFSVFSILNKNAWQIEIINDKDQWVYYFLNQKLPPTKQDTLKKYCETLTKMEQATKLKE